MQSGLTTIPTPSLRPSAHTGAEKGLFRGLARRKQAYRDDPRKVMLRRAETVTPGSSHLVVSPPAPALWLRGKNEGSDFHCEAPDMSIDSSSKSKDRKEY